MLHLSNPCIFAFLHLSLSPGTGRSSCSTFGNWRATFSFPRDLASVCAPHSYDRELCLSSVSQKQLLKWSCQHTWILGWVFSLIRIWSVSVILTQRRRVKNMLEGELEVKAKQLEFYLPLISPFMFSVSVCAMVRGSLRWVIPVLGIIFHWRSLG